MSKGMSAIALLGIAVTALSPLRAQPAPKLSLRVAGPEEVVLPSGSSCTAFKDSGGNIDVPDQPMRAFRNRAGQIRVFASTYANLAFVSRDLRTIQHDGCRSMLPPRMDPDPAHYADRGWLVAPYPMPDGSIYSLVHDEYWGGAHDALCKQRLNGAQPWAGVCVYINLTAARSNDGGRTFQPLAGDIGLVAARPERFVNTMGRAGYRDPSNIVFNPKDGYFYFAAFADPGGQQKMGSCIFRTRKPGGEPWLAWDGSGFRARLSGAYGGAPAAPACAPITNLSVKSLIRDEASGLFVAAGLDMRAGGFFYMTSANLVRWGSPMLLKSAVTSNHWTPGGEAPSNYASLIDPGSSSPAFDTMRATPYLYFVRFDTSWLKIVGRSRSIIRVPLVVSR